MENIEIIMVNVKKEHIDLITRNEIKFRNSNTISSYFYNEKKSENIELSEIQSFKDYFEDNRIGNIFSKEIFLGEKIFDVIILFSFNNKLGDIELNFKEIDFVKNDKRYLKNKIKNIFNKLTELLEKYEIEEIRIGYEPATDSDMLLALIDKNGIKVVNKYKCLLSKIITSLYSSK